MENARGDALLSFERMGEKDLACLDPTIPLPFALVALWCGDRCLVVFDRYRAGWELPGGTLEPGESPRAGAFRELDEESGQRPDDLEFVGVATTRVGSERRIEYGAIYRGRIAVPAPFTPNAETARITWWNPAQDLPGLDPIDAALARLCADPAPLG